MKNTISGENWSCDIEGDDLGVSKTVPTEIRNTVRLLDNQGYANVSAKSVVDDDGGSVTLKEGSMTFVFSGVSKADEPNLIKGFHEDDKHKFVTLKVDGIEP